ncbi:MAG TPA: alanine racemase [Holophaga sp.]|nr:alanine racemase [Holophaga sp.]
MHPTWLEIDVSAIAHNCACIRRDTGTALMAVVKGEAYGHGAVEVARAAVEGGAAWLGVARCGEAMALRQGGIGAPVLVLGTATPPEVDAAMAEDVTLTLHGEEILQLYAARAKAAGRKLKVHLKLDTGLGRLGVLPEDAVAFAGRVKREPWLEVDGVFSHLSAAEEDDPLNALQADRFETALAALAGNGLRPRWAHLANSAAAFLMPRTRHDLVRVANVVVGVRIRPDLPLPACYRPAMTWKARLASCRRLPAGWGVGYGHTYHTAGEELIGVVPVGYGDGLKRVPGHTVLVGGQRCPVVGRLCLDQLMVRLPQPFPIGEEVVLIGRQGREEIRLHDLAILCATSQVDCSTSIHARVPRIYLRPAQPGPTTETSS